MRAAVAGISWSGDTLAQITRSMLRGSVPLAVRASRAASIPSTEAGVPVSAIRRERMPVLCEIHSSEVSSWAGRSLLPTTRGGTQVPSAASATGRPCSMLTSWLPFRLRSSRVQQGESQAGRAGHLLAHISDALPLADGPTQPGEFDLEPQRLAGDHLPFETDVVHRRTKDDLATVLLEREYGYSAGLGESLDLQHAWEDRVTGEVPPKDVLLAGQGLFGHHPLGRLEFEHPVQPEKGVAVRNNFFDLLLVEHEVHTPGKCKNRRSRLPPP